VRVTRAPAILEGLTHGCRWREWDRNTVES
jgi:hypothetical protein